MWQNNGAGPFFTGAVTCGDGTPVLTSLARVHRLPPLAVPHQDPALPPASTAICVYPTWKPGTSTSSIASPITSPSTWLILGTTVRRFMGRGTLTPRPSALDGEIHLSWQPSTDGCQLTDTTLSTTQPNPALRSDPTSQSIPYIAYIDQLSNQDRSHYNALQVSLTQRTSHGLSFTASYTYSHGLDDVSQNFGSSVPLNNRPLF